MSFEDASMALLASSAGDTVKLFDVSVQTGDRGDPCMLSYTPLAGCQVNSVKWNHTNLVLASAGDDKKISLWRKNGQSMGTIPMAGTDSGENAEESIFSISFSNKVSRYICSGGSGQVVRIWDLQRKRCIKRLRGHSHTISGVMYNCKDEHLASINLGGDLLVHNLASGARAAELKDPNGQVLRVLDYSRNSRHLVVTAGDDGSVHLWDTTGRNPKVSWIKQHSAPTVGTSFSPSNDKSIASVGLDKKLYTYDSVSRRPASVISYEAPFSSLAFREDGLILAAGTSDGRVVFYDVRGKPEPFSVLGAYSSSEAVTSLCWQRSKPVIVNESNCTAETALFGGAVEDSILMPDPLPSMSSSSLSMPTVVSSSRTSGRSGPSLDTAPLTTSTDATSTMPHGPSAEETPLRSHLWPSGSLSRLNAPRSTYNFNDEMDVFSPLVDVQPVTPSLNKLWDDHNGAKKDHQLVDKKSSMLFPSSRRFNLTEDGDKRPSIDNSIFHWKSSSVSKQDDSSSSVAHLGSTPTPTPSFKSDDSITPPEAWGGERLSDKVAHLRLPNTVPPRFGMFTLSGQTSGSMLTGFQDPLSTSHSYQSTTTSLNFSYPNLRHKDSTSIQETSLGFESRSSSTMPLTHSPTSMAMPKRLSTYAERISHSSSYSDGPSLAVGSPKTKKMGSETRDELLNNLLSKSDASASVTESGVLPLANGGNLQPQKVHQMNGQQGTSFTLQLFQRALEESLDSSQQPMHDKMRNLHLEVLKQFHMQELQFSSAMSSMLENQAELAKEVRSLRQEIEQLRRLL